MTEPASRLQHRWSVIICDDVRRELGNKFSFMGVYGDTIYTPRVPQEVLDEGIVGAVVLWLVYALDITVREYGSHARFSLTGPSGKVIDFGGQDIEWDENQSVMLIYRLNLRITRFGRFDASLQIGDTTLSRQFSIVERIDS